MNETKKKEKLQGKGKTKIRQTMKRTGALLLALSMCVNGNSMDVFAAEVAKTNAFGTEVESFVDEETTKETVETAKEESIMETSEEEQLSQPEIVMEESTEETSTGETLIEKEEVETTEQEKSVSMESETSANIAEATNPKNDSDDTDSGSVTGQIQAGSIVDGEEVIGTISTARDDVVIVLFDKDDDSLDSSKSGNTATGIANEATIYNYLRNTLGLNVAAACGVLGNMYWESGKTFSPTAYNSSEGAWGIVQWEESRLTYLQSKYPSSWKTLDSQLAFLKWEFEGGDYNGPSTYSYLKNVANTSAGAKAAAEYFAQYYERCDSSTYSYRSDYAVNTFWAYYGSSVITVPTGTQTISDGDYHIVSALNNSFGLNVAYNSTKACANIQLHNNMEDSNTTSVVTVKYMGNGYYKLIMRNSGKAIDVNGGLTSNGTNVQQYDDNGTDAQRWVIKDAGDGYFYIISKCNGLYLDVADGVANDYQNIQVYTGNETKAQKWKFIAWGASTGETISDGVYYIASKCNTSRSLSIANNSSSDGANVLLWDTTFSNQYQQWKFEYQSAGFYKITNVATGKVLDVYGGATASGTNVQQYQNNGTSAQRWIVKDVGEGYYSFVSKCNGHYMDLSGGVSSNGSNVQVYLGNGTNAQKWMLVKKLSAPTISSVCNVSGGVEVKWGAVSGATKYCVYRKTGSGNWSKLASTTSTSYIDKTVKSGTIYSFTVQCISPSESSYDTTGVSIMYLTAGKISSLTNTAKGVKVKWKKVTGASGYILYRKTSGGSWKKIKTISKSGITSYTDTGVKKKNGTTYYYAVKPYSGSTKAAYVSAKTVRLTGVSITSLKNVKGKKLKVKWKKDRKVTGYQIQYSLKSNFSSVKTVTVKKKATTSTTVSKLKKGKKYYVRIRTYKKVSGKKYYSVWSKTKSLKISK